MVGLLTAAGTAVPVFAGLAHSDVALVVISVVAGAASGSAACFFTPSKKVLDFYKRQKKALRWPE